MPEFPVSYMASLTLLGDAAGRLLMGVMYAYTGVLAGGMGAGVILLVIRSLRACSQFKKPLSF